MILNDVGKIIDKWWIKISKKYPQVRLDIYQIMPDHIHGIIIINNVGVDPCVDSVNYNNDRGRTHGSAPTLGNIIQWFKTMVTNEYIRNIEAKHWKYFNKRLFQRSFYDHIIRNEIELNEIRQYINSNPSRWDND